MVPSTASIAACRSSMVALGANRTNTLSAEYCAPPLCAMCSDEVSSRSTALGVDEGACRGTVNTIVARAWTSARKAVTFVGTDRLIVRAADDIVGRIGGAGAFVVV